MAGIRKKLTNGQNLSPSKYKRIIFTHYRNLFEDGYLFSDICLKYFIGDSFTV